MANADGSIRIEATVSDEQAKKQIAQMSKDIEKQTAAVERQAEKVKKLAAQWEKEMCIRDRNKIGRAYP